MNGMNKHCDEIRELLAAYSMGATDAEETALVERYLPECPDAVRELADYMALNESMLYLPELKQQRAEETIATNEQAAGVSPSVAQPRRTIPKQTIETASKPTLAEKLTTQTQAAIPEDKVRRMPSAWVYRLVGVAGILLLLATNAFWAQQVQDLNEQLAVAAAITPEVVEVVETVEVEVIVTQEVIVIQEATPEIIEVLVTPETPQMIQGEQVQHRAVAAEIEEYGNVSAVFAWDEDTQAGAFYVEGLAHSSQERLYQLWLLREDDVILVGRVVVDDAETGILLFQVDTLIDEYSTFLLTIEPEDDSEQRSPLISGQL